MHSPNSKRENEIVLILGRKGEGKTTLLKMLLLERVSLGRDIVVIDPLQQFPREFSEVTYFTSDDDKENLEVLGRLYNRGSVDIFIDELDLLTTAQDSQKSITRKLFRYARNKDINLYSTAKRTSNINKDSLSNADILCIFKTTEGNDLKRLREVYEIDPEELKRLNKFEYIEVNLNKGLHKKKKIDTIILERILKFM